MQYLLLVADVLLRILSLSPRRHWKHVISPPFFLSLQPAPLTASTSPDLLAAAQIPRPALAPIDYKTP